MNSYSNGASTGYAQLIQDKLEKYVRGRNVSSKKLADSVIYSLISGGKMHRPVLTLDFCKLCGGRIENALPLACAVEMVHTHSLIHDDLPCMDNDSTRRGKPSNHIVNGEDFAVLSGDALLSLAIEIITLDETVKFLGKENVIKAINVLVSSCGISGMIDGQALDIEENISQNLIVPSTGYANCFETIEKMYFKKTGMLFAAACALGCIAANAEEKQINNAKAFGECLGVAYQILDDLKDRQTDKKTIYTSKLTIEKGKLVAKNLLGKALDSLKNFKVRENSYALALLNNLQYKLGQV